jgi:hypothetical protein
MYIIKKFHDYYDVGMSAGIDKTIIYRRITSKLMNTKIPEFKEIMDRNYGYTLSNGYPFIDVTFGILGFCGKLYPLYIINNENVFATIPKMMVYVSQKVSSSGPRASSIMKKIITAFYKVNNYNGQSDYTRTLSFSSYVMKLNKPELFFRFNAPIFQYYCFEKAYGVIINPQLKDTGFSSLMDPWTAFQELSMFVGGVLCQPKDVPQIIDDKVLRDSKGFDDMSFKTVSPGKKSKFKEKK